MYRRRYTPRRYNGNYRKRTYAPRRSYASAYIPSDNGGIRGSPMVKVGRGFRGDYSRSAVEKKFIDTASATYACDTTGSVTALNLMDEGTSVSTRIGRKVCIKSVQVRGTFGSNDTTVSAPSLARVMLVWDKQANGVIATIAEILSASTANSFMNLDNRERFVVLMDKHFAMGVLDTATAAPGAPLSANVAHYINKYKKMPPNSFTIFDGTGAGIADINTGALLLVTIGNAATSASWSLIAACRVRYTDS